MRTGGWTGLVSHALARRCTGVSALNPVRRIVTPLARVSYAQTTRVCAMKGMHVLLRGDTHVSVTSAARPLADTSMLQAIMAGLDRRVRRKVLVIANGKGGVGKSSLAAALAVVLTMIGKRVCLIELDPQGNNGEDLGFIGTDLYDNGEGQARAIFDGTGFKPTGEARPGLWVVPGGEALEAVAEELYIQRRIARDTGNDSWLYMYANSIAQMAEDVDIFILDVAPGSLVLQTQAMIAGDMVLVPSRSDESSRKGLRTIAKRFVEAKPNNPSLTLIGIVLFGINSSGTKVTASIRGELERDIRGAAPVLESVIRYVEAVAVKCRQLGLVPAELAREPGIDANTAVSAKRLAGDYRALATEILTIIAQLVHADAA
jgi:chromosome partitioning protein